MKSISTFIVSFLVLILLAFGFFRFTNEVKGANDKVNLNQEIEKLQNELNQKQQQIKELEQKLADTLKQKQTLAGQISYYNGQINLTQYKIDRLQTEVQLLEKSIDLLDNKIDILDVSLQKVKKVLSERLVQEYKLSRASSFSFLSNKPFNYGLSLRVYIERLANADRKMVNRLTEIKREYRNQKTAKEEKKEQLDKVKQSLAYQKKVLSQQQHEKERLLEITKGNEKHYQEMLATLKAEQENMAKALNGLLASIKIQSGQKVKKGDIIGRQGNTGKVYPRPTTKNPTAGSHLHFMVLTCLSYYKCSINPEPYLNNSKYHNPLNSWRVTQKFGKTAYSYVYPDGRHHGYDMVDYHGAPVYAIADGEVFYGTDGAGGKYAIIKHSDNFYSAYWHLQ